MRRNRGIRTRATAAGLAVALVAACGIGNPSSKSDALTFVSTGSPFQDYQNKAWAEPFTAQTGVKVRNDGPVDEARMKTMVEARKVSWDVVDTSAAAAVQYCGKYLEKLDFSVIDKNVFPKGTVGDCGVPAYNYSLIFMYDKEKYKNDPPTKIGDFFDVKKYPGRRIVPPEIAVGLLEAALMGDGVPEKQLYPLDLDRAFRKLEPIKKSTTFAKTYGQQQQMMVDRQVDMALVLSARAYQSLKAGAPFQPVWDKTVVNWDDLVVPKGAPNKEQAMKFIAFASRNDPSAKLAQLASVQPINESIVPNYDPIQQRVNPFTPDRKHSIVRSDAEWWGQNFDAVTKRYTTWLAG
ncbi:ABC transporter substrate-binding protein [Actinomadura graeca]|uniref:ABC transporter substrate-binding protein n=1 Tax=Actinomadura graeca TaxID=2750812 RepID=A0ABX8QRY4_9ACTN|nr:ABC transporter substrate-binding protein [Actinomadura graeca]QXJ21497.1 ABC transporter substrate-binding protein [Actinomadura graeca]